MSSFHGSMHKNKDGSNRIIEKNKWCLWPTTIPFWKKAEDVPFKIRTLMMIIILVQYQNFNL